MSDLDKALARYPAARNGDGVAEASIGDIFFSGDGVPANPTLAENWYRKAAEHGNAYAQWRLGRMLDGRARLPETLAESNRWLRKAADQKYTNAMIDLGVNAYNGRGGVEPNYVDARKWFEKADALGDATATSNLGVMYFYGQGVKAEPAKGIGYWKTAAFAGNNNASYRLGLQYVDGSNIPADRKLAIGLMRLAAGRGGTEAADWLKAQNVSPNAAYVGVSIQNFTPEMAESLNLGTLTGSIVSASRPGSPAANSGIQIGDIITKVDGRPVVENSELIYLLASYEPRSTLSLDILRTGKPLKVEVRTTTRPPASVLDAEDRSVPNKTFQEATPAVRATVFGGTFGDLSTSASVIGALLVDVPAKGPLADLGMAKGDVVTRVNFSPVYSASELSEAVGVAIAQGRKHVMLAVLRGDRTTFVTTAPSR